MPASFLGFSASVEVGDLTLENSTTGNSLEFDIDIFREDMDITVWRTSKRGLAGPTTTVALTPEYTFLAIPRPALAQPFEVTANDVLVTVRDPNTPIVRGAEFRYTFEPFLLPDGRTRNTAIPGNVTDATWGTALVLDSQTLLFRPNSNSLFQLKFRASGRYRIFARFVDAVGRYGPVGELGSLSMVVPESPTHNFGGPPSWTGTLNHMHKFTFGDDTPLLSIPSGAPNTLTIDQWDGFTGSLDVPDSYASKYRLLGSANWTDGPTAAGSATEMSITGLTNGQVYEVEMWRIDGSTIGTPIRRTFKTSANATAPVAPDVAASGRTASIQVHSTVHEEDERALITGHQYKIATTQTGLSSASWTSAANTADPDATFIITGLNANTTYYLQTRAVNGVGNGAASAVVTEATQGGTSYSSWANSTPAGSVQSGLNANNLTTEGTWYLYNTRDGASNLPPAASGSISSVGVLIFFQESQTKQVQLSSRIQSFSNFYWLGHIRTRTRASANAAWGGWSAWSVVNATTNSEYWATDANTATTKKGYIIQPSAASNAPDLHRNDIDTNPVVMMVGFDSGTGNANRQTIRYEHFGYNQYTRTITGSGSFTLGAPSKPTLTATARTYGNSVDLAATIAQDNGSPVSKWEIAWASTIAGLNAAEWVEVDDAIGDNLSHTVTNLSPGTLYYFKARATNELGTSTVADRKSATTSSTTSYLGFNTGSAANPYRVDPSDFSTARSIVAELNANNRTPFAYEVGVTTINNVAAVIQFEGSANISGEVYMTLTNSQRGIDLRLYRGTTLVGSSTGTGDTESVTWTSTVAGDYTLLLVSSGSSTYGSNTALRLTLGAGGASEEEGASGLSGDAAPQHSPLPVRDLRLTRFGSTGVQASWRAPGDASNEPVAYELEYDAGAGWHHMAETEDTHLDGAVRRGGRHGVARQGAVPRWRRVRLGRGQRGGLAGRRRGAGRWRPRGLRGADQQRLREAEMERGHWQRGRDILALRRCRGL